MQNMGCLYSKTTTIHVPNIGSLIGNQQKTRNGVPINVFTSIPYAKPPIGELRFALPQSLEYPSEITLDCTQKDSTKCIQVNPLFPGNDFVNWIWNWKTSEDCLYLNVYTPSFPDESSPGGLSKTDLPVIVWFHGGAFCIESNDSSQYGPDYLLDHDVILVGVNYRLGPFGFLSLECDQAPG